MLFFYELKVLFQLLVEVDFLEIINSFLLLILFSLIFILVVFFVLICLWLLIYRLNGFKREKGSYRYVGFGSWLKKLFYEFPRRIALDYLTFNPDTFREYGFHLITGKQGKGKTITLVYLLLRYQKMYPRLIVKTNMNYKYEDGNISHWKDLVNSSNGIYGEIDVIDEVQNWFSCAQSKDFPPEMLQEVTQQRKQRKMIIGTSQVFTRVAKPIRENVYMLYEPTTLFGCLTIVRKFEPVLDDKGTMISKKTRGMFFFIHNDKIRDAFDTYKKILDMSESGFNSRSEQLTNTNELNVNQIYQSFIHSKK